MHHFDTKSCMDCPRADPARIASNCKRVCSVERPVIADGRCLTADAAHIKNAAHFIAERVPVD